MNSEIIMGIDEAGRGPVIGPLVICAYAIEKYTTKKLTDLGVKDSKLLSEKKRNDLYDTLCQIAFKYKTHHIKAIDIDELRKRHSLNIIEQKMMLKLVKDLDVNPSTIYIDAADVKEERYGIPFKEACPNSTIISRHGADKHYPVVSAASIIAKVERDRAIRNIESEFGSKIGSGYPSDPNTKKFLISYYNKHKTFPLYVRHSWNTIKNIKQKYQNRKLAEYFE